MLLLLLFLIGCGQALTTPAWQAIQPELVPREQIPAAAALASMSVNGARAIGPAVAGVLVSLSGPTTVFALNAFSFIGIVMVLLWWRRPVEEATMPLERPISALSAGRRYIRSSPVIRRILLRTVLFTAPASALWGLLAVIAANQLNLSSSGYGLLLGALGVGAVLGAVVLSRLHARFGQNQLMVMGAVGFAGATVVLATVHVLAAVLAALVVGGVAWLLTMSTLNASMQLSLPAWVRARGLSVYQLVFTGSQAIGSLVWGVVAGATSGVTALLISAALLIVCGVSVAWWPLHPATGTLDVTPSAHWGEPALVFEPDPQDGPVVVLQSYVVAPEDEAGFLALMQRVRRSRQRTGAMEWGSSAAASPPTPSWNSSSSGHGTNICASIWCARPPSIWPSSVRSRATSTASRRCGISSRCGTGVDRHRRGGQRRHRHQRQQLHSRFETDVAVH